MSCDICQNVILVVLTAKVTAPVNASASVPTDEAGLSPPLFSVSQSSNRSLPCPVIVRTLLQGDILIRHQGRVRRVVQPTNTC